MKTILGKAFIFDNEKITYSDYGQRVVLYCKFNNIFKLSSQYFIAKEMYTIRMICTLFQKNIVMYNSILQTKCLEGQVKLLMCPSL